MGGGNEIRERRDIREITRCLELSLSAFECDVIKRIRSRIILVGLYVDHLVGWSAFVVIRDRLNEEVTLWKVKENCASIRISSEITTETGVGRDRNENARDTRGRRRGRGGGVRRGSELRTEGVSEGDGDVSETSGVEVEERKGMA